MVNNNNNNKEINYNYKKIKIYNYFYKKLNFLKKYLFKIEDIDANLIIELDYKLVSILVIDNI